MPKISKLTLFYLRFHGEDAHHVAQVLHFIFPLHAPQGDFLVTREYHSPDYLVQEGLVLSKLSL